MNIQMADLFSIFLALVAFILLVNGLFIVKQQTVAVIERFGKFVRVAHPGLNLRIPVIERTAGEVNLRMQQLDVPVETKTKDNVFVKIMISVQFQVIPSKIYEAFYKLEDPDSQIRAFVFDVVRAKVPNIDLDDVFSKKDDIAVEVKSELQEVVSDFGYQMIKALVTDIEPNENVKNAMNEINTAQRLRIAAQERGEAEKIMRIKQAEAEAESNILHGKGIAGQRQAIVEGLGQSVDEIKRKHPDLDSQKVMQMILVIQYFDTLKEIGAASKNSTLFVPHSPQNVTDISQKLMEAIFAVKES